MASRHWVLERYAPPNQADAVWNEKPDEASLIAAGMPPAIVSTFVQITSWLSLAPRYVEKKHCTWELVDKTLKWPKTFAQCSSLLKKRLNAKYVGDRMYWSGVLQDGHLRIRNEQDGTIILAQMLF